MAERTFKSPGVRAFEIDRSGPTPTGPSGVPAGVIGTAQEGLRLSCLLPFLISLSLSQNLASLRGDQFGPIAAQEWLRNSGALTYVRVLGAGNAKRRSTSDGTVTNAGFVVGAELPLGIWPYWTKLKRYMKMVPLGRTYFLGCYMSRVCGFNNILRCGHSNLR